MEAADRVRLGEDEKVVVAAQVARPVGEARAAKLGLAEAQRLDHRPHRAVEDEDARRGGALSWSWTLGIDWLLLLTTPPRYFASSDSSASRRLTISSRRSSTSAAA